MVDKIEFNESDNFGQRLTEADRLRPSSEYPPEFRAQLDHESKLMIDRIMGLEEADRQLVIDQMPQVYADMKHRLGVLDSMLDNEMCSGNSNAIIKSRYYQENSKKIEALELEIATVVIAYWHFTDQDIEEVFNSSPAES